MTPPAEKESAPRKPAAQSNSAALTDPLPNPPPPPTPIELAVQRFLAIREALRGPAVDDPNRDQKLWVIPGAQ